MITTPNNRVQVRIRDLSLIYRWLALRRMIRMIPRYLAIHLSRYLLHVALHRRVTSCDVTDHCAMKTDTQAMTSGQWPNQPVKFAVTEHDILSDNYCQRRHCRAALCSGGY